MAEVLGVCDKCGGMVKAAAVQGDGTASFDPTPVLEHWKASPDCNGAGVSSNVPALVHAGDVAEAAILMPKITGIFARLEAAGRAMGLRNLEQLHRDLLGLERKWAPCREDIGAERSPAS